MKQYDYKKGLSAMFGGFVIWGIQPLYWDLCGEMDTFFLMTCRIIFAALACLVILQMQGKLPQLRDAFRTRDVMKREVPAMLLLFGDWFIFLWAVQNGRVLECSLGYYIQPLVVFMLGAVVFKEKITWKHFVILAVVTVGIVLSAGSFGGIPYVTISLALLFAVYAALKKSLRIDSIVSTTSEIVMMVPFALLYLLLFRMGENGVAGLTLKNLLLVIGSGVITGIPMVLYAIAVRNLPLMTVGIGQYLSPTLSIFTGLLMGELLTREKLVSFCFIWAGVILYVLNTLYEERRKKAL